MTPKSLSRYRTFIKIILVYTLLVILWGAWVRISGSGDGCGESWPLCHDQLIPHQAEGKTWIELFHRLTSGFYGIVILVFSVVGFRQFEKGHPCRRLGIAVLIFTILEALIGARLVLAGLVGANATFDRGLIMALHLLNTFLLTGSLVLSYELSFYKKPRWSIPSPDLKSWFSFVSLLVFVLVGMSGAFAALSTTLFPSESLLTGFVKDFDSSAPLYVRLRALHPILALIFIGGLYFITLQWLSALKQKHREPRHKTKWLMALLAATGIIGVINLLLLSPLWSKIAHLALAEILWMSLLFAILAIHIDESSIAHQDNS